MGYVSRSSVHSDVPSPGDVVWCVRPSLEECSNRYGIVLSLEKYEEAEATEMGLGPRTMARVLVGTTKWLLELDDIDWYDDECTTTGGT